jgi:uncharacterized protein (TIGR03382 family)
MTIGATPSLATTPGVLLSCPTPAPGTQVRWVGPGQTYTRLWDAVVAASNAYDTRGNTGPGDTICMAAGDYKDENAFATIKKPMTIVGVGGYAHLEAVNEQPPDGKAILTISSDVTIKGLEFSGSTVPDANGAGIRWEGGNLTIRQSYFHDNENGILGGGKVIDIQNSKFVNNGGGTGNTHAMYVFGTQTIVDSSYFESTNVGHHVKSLSPNTVVTNSTFEDGLGDPNHIPSYSIDLSNGGAATIRNNTFIQRNGQGSNSATNGIVVNYNFDRNGEFGKAPVNALTIEDNTLRNFRQGGVFVQNSTNVSADIEHNNIVGSGTTIVHGTATLANNANGFVPPAKLNTPAPAIVDDFANGLALMGGIQNPNGIQGNSGMTALGANIYLANRYQGVGVLDRQTGTSTLYHGPQDIEALGNDGTNLLAGTFTTDTVYRMATDGTILGTITLQLTNHLGITGIDSDGARLFVGSYDDGNVHIFDMAGLALGIIKTGLFVGIDVLSGLSFDRGDGTLWLTAGFGDGTIYHFDLAGDLLGMFRLMTIGSFNDMPIFAMFDITPMQSAAADIVEPGTATIFAFALLAAAWLRRRRPWVTPVPI